MVGKDLQPPGDVNCGLTLLLILALVLFTPARS